MHGYLCLILFPFEDSWVHLLGAGWRPQWEPAGKSWTELFTKVQTVLFYMLNWNTVLIGFNQQYCAVCNGLNSLVPHLTAVDFQVISRLGTELICVLFVNCTSLRCTPGQLFRTRCLITVEGPGNTFRVVYIYEGFKLKQKQKPYSGLRCFDN